MRVAQSERYDLFFLLDMDRLPVSRKIIQDFISIYDEKDADKINADKKVTTKISTDKKVASKTNTDKKVASKKDTDKKVASKKDTDKKIESLKSINVNYHDIEYVFPHSFPS